jgi:hypothetical protein
MIYNQYKYELLSIINMELDKKNYNNRIVDCLSYFSSLVKDLEYDIDDTASNIRLAFDNNMTSYIDGFLFSLKKDILDSMN